MIRCAAFVCIEQRTSENQCLIAFRDTAVNLRFNSAAAGVVTDLSARFGYATVKHERSFSVVNHHLSGDVRAEPHRFGPIIIVQDSYSGDSLCALPEVGPVPILWHVRRFDEEHKR